MINKKIETKAEFVKVHKKGESFCLVLAVEGDAWNMV